MKALTTATFLLLFSAITQSQITTTLHSGIRKKEVTFENKDFRVLTDTVKSIRVTASSVEAVSKTRNNEMIHVIKEIQNIETRLNANRGVLIDILRDTNTSRTNLSPQISHYIVDLKQYIDSNIVRMYASEDAAYFDIYNKWYAAKQKKDSIANEEFKIKSRKDYEESMMKLKLRQISWHNYLTIFCGRELNEAQFRLADYLNMHMQMTESENNLVGNTLKCKYVEGISNGNPLYLNVTYQVREEGGYYYIENVVITGSNERVINLFINYWPTQLQQKQLKRNEWAYCYLAPDRIGLFVDANGKAKIVIEKMP